MQNIEIQHGMYIHGRKIADILLFLRWIYIYFVNLSYSDMRTQIREHFK
ncbi:hypothetical protein N836_05520 [Leptolyngbya sp. Heron Island J]|nr:hypothetical protein N836_05520 [Leptolyngbya sp. Heron Island J]